MGIGMIAVIAISIVLIVYLVRLAATAAPGQAGTATAGAATASAAAGDGRQLAASSAPQETPREIVQRRYASGEIDRDEYLQKLADL